MLASLLLLGWRSCSPLGLSLAGNCFSDSRVFLTLHPSLEICSHTGVLVRQGRAVLLQ